MTVPVKTGEMLAKAGRAGLEVIGNGGHTSDFYEEAECAAIARAVLDTLQIECSHPRCSAYEKAERLGKLLNELVTYAKVRLEKPEVYTAQQVFEFIVRRIEQERDAK